MDKERETLIRYLFGTLGDRETVNLEQQLKNDIEFQERFSLIQQEFSEVSGTLSIQNTNRETSSSPFTLQKESSALKSPAIPPETSGWSTPFIPKRLDLEIQPPSPFVDKTPIPRVNPTDPTDHHPITAPSKLPLADSPFFVQAAFYSQPPIRPLVGINSAQNFELKPPFAVSAAPLSEETSQGPDSKEVYQLSTPEETRQLQFPGFIPFEAQNDTLTRILGVADESADVLAVSVAAADVSDIISDPVLAQILTGTFPKPEPSHRNPDSAFELLERQQNPAKESSEPVVSVSGSRSEENETEPAMVPTVVNLIPEISDVPASTLSTIHSDSPVSTAVQPEVIPPEPELPLNPVMSSVLSSELTPEDQFLSQLLGRKLKPDDRFEYYWEDENQCNAEENNQSISIIEDSTSFIRRTFSGTVSLLGRSLITVWDTACLAFDFIFKCLGFNQRFRHHLKKQTSQISDMVISVALGMMIAALVVFPVLKIIGKEIFSVIFKSTVRQIGQNVQLTEHSNSADLLPFVSEQLLFPQYQAVEFTNPSSNNPANSQPAGKSGNEGFNKFPAVIPMDPPENFPPSDSNIPLNSLKIDENYLRF